MRPLEVVGFADEEGLRFGTAYLGSGAMAGLPRRSTRGTTTACGSATCCQGEPAARDPAGGFGYCEVHIEQGPVLERRDGPVGVVTGITGQTQPSWA